MYQPYAHCFDDLGVGQALSFLLLDVGVLALEGGYVLYLRKMLWTQQRRSNATFLFFVLDYDEITIRSGLLNLPIVCILDLKGRCKICI
jgi:hypothetical protein